LEYGALVPTSVLARYRCPKVTRKDIKSRLNSSFEIPNAKRAVRGDYNPTQALNGKNLISAAVLVPVIDHPNEMTLLLTQRTENLSTHGGQISFPGGHVEPCDKNLSDTALRESEEEINLSRSKIEIVGRLDQYLTRTGFSVAPIVGVVDPGYEAVPDPKEVARIFEIPLSFFLDLKNYKRHSYTDNGEQRIFHAITYNGHYIWGATAGIIKNFREALLG